jgi:hypothetical protein
MLGNLVLTVHTAWVLSLVDLVCLRKKNREEGTTLEAYHDHSHSSVGWHTKAVKSLNKTT